MSTTFHPRTYGPRERTAAVTGVQRFEAHLVVVAMAGVSVVMWIAVPLLWLQAAAALAGGRPAPTDFLLVFAGLTLSVALLAKLLFHLNRLHCELIGKPLKRVPRAYLQSYCENRAPCVSTACDTIQEVCAMGAIIALAVWIVA
jgi:hypothetical protein